MKNLSRAFAFSLVLAASTAGATATPEEAARLGKDWTAVGAIRAGNAEGTIPEWKGGAFFTDEQRSYTVKQLEDIRRNHPEILEEALDQNHAELAKPLFTITAANLAQYKDSLSAGHQALFALYPSYKIVVYPSARTAFWPDEINQATIANATRAALEGSDTLKGARLGFPFPVPKTGAEVIWNHKLRFRGSSARRYNNQAIVKPDGGVLMTKLIEDVKLKYANLEEPGDGRLFAYYLSKVVAPARVAGQLTLVHEVADFSTGGRLAWLFSPGLARVVRAPDVGYDNPAVGTDNEQYTDQIDVFNGALDRYSWKLLGRKEFYIPYNAYLLNSPKTTYKTLLTARHINQDLARYERHRVWVVEATLKPGLRHNFSKRVFYVDEDSWAIAVVDCYDSRGQLWKVQEAHLVTAPFIPTTTGSPELIYDLQSKRYFATALSQEDLIPDFERKFEDSYFEPGNLKQMARRQ